jgi:hypothetical protein
MSRLERIQNFKHRISALRATTKSYRVSDKKSGASVGTLDSSTSGKTPGSFSDPFDDSSVDSSFIGSVFDVGSAASSRGSVDGDLFRYLEGRTRRESCGTASLKPVEERVADSGVKEQSVPASSNKLHAHVDSFDSSSLDSSSVLLCQSVNKEFDGTATL